MDTAEAEPETKVEHPLPTFEEAMKALGFDGLIEGPWEHDRARRVEIKNATDRDGRIFVSCGGAAILRILWFKEELRYDGHPMRTHRRPAYLVFDDEAGKVWDRRRQADGPSATIAALGARPMPAMRLAQSG